MTGKWHLGHADGDTAHLPGSHGFDRYYALDASGADNWEQKPYMPYYQVQGSTPHAQAAFSNSPIYNQCIDSISSP